MFGDLKAGAAGIACLALGLLTGGVAVRAYDAWVTIPAAERVATERADARWQKLIDDAKAQAAEARRKAEAEIADAERVFIERDRLRASQMTALEQALEQEQAHAPIPTAADRACVCRPAVSRGVRDALQGLGRTEPRADPAKPDATVRGRR